MHFSSATGQHRKVQSALHPNLLHEIPTPHVQVINNAVAFQEGTESSIVFAHSFPRFPLRPSQYRQTLGLLVVDG